MLYEKITGLKEKSNSKLWGKSVNPIFNLFDEQKCKEIDDRAKEDPIIRKQRAVMMGLLKEENITISKKHEECFSLYNEICVYDLLKEKDNSVQFVPKSKMDGISTPDFSKKSLSGKEINIELKTLSFKGSDSNFRRIQKEMEGTDPLQPDWLVASAFGYDKKEMESNTRRTVIEQLGERIINHYRKGAETQVSYNGNPGILVIDTILLEQTLMLYIQDILPGFQLDCYYSGCLWNAAFGKVGDKIYQCIRQPANIKHEPVPPGGQPLRKNGILIELESLPAIFFIIRTVHRTPGRIIGFSKSDLCIPEIAECLKIFSDFQNNEANDNPNKITWNPLGIREHSIDSNDKVDKQIIEIGN